MEFSGSLSENRVTIGLTAPLRTLLTAEGRRLGLRTPELVRFILLEWMQRVEQRAGAVGPAPTSAITRFITAGEMPAAPFRLGAKNSKGS
jgi:hypothetical protein